MEEEEEEEEEGKSLQQIPHLLISPSHCKVNQWLRANIWQKEGIKNGWMDGESTLNHEPTWEFSPPKTMVLIHQHLDELF